MLARKEQEKAPNFLPESWSKKVVETLSTIYKGECASHQKTFDVHALTYPDELLLAVSFTDEGAKSIPVSYLASVDLVSQKKPDEFLHKLIDSVGIFFDQYFADPNWNDYSVRWVESEYKGLDFFYKISREHVTASIAADKLLAE